MEAVQLGLGLAYISALPEHPVTFDSLYNDGSRVAWIQICNAAQKYVAPVLFGKSL